MTNDEKALSRLYTMGDWLEMQSFNANNLMNDLKQYKDSWKPYNVKKPNNRWGLSITSLDGGLGGIPDLDSLSEYNNRHCLLYTSPSPRDATLSRMPSSA